MSHRLQVLIPEELDVEIRKMARRSRVSKGEWVRRAIVQAIEETTRAADPLEQLGSLNAPTGDIAKILRDIHKGRS